MARTEHDGYMPFWIPALVKRGLSLTRVGLRPAGLHQNLGRKTWKQGAIDGADWENLYLNPPVIANPHAPPERGPSCLSNGFEAFNQKTRISHCDEGT
jgi:hypothetical protein